MTQFDEQSGAVFDLAVIGSGPGGYEAALKAARSDMKVCVIEKAALGGVCVNWGCIPTKALLRSAEVFDLLRNPGVFGVSASEPRFDLAQAVKRSRNVALKSSKGVEYMLRRANVEVIQGEALLTGQHDIAVTGSGGEFRQVRAANIIIASGARPKVLPGLETDGRRLITSREALIMKDIPESMIVAGGGAIGVEMAWFYAKAGTRVTLVELMPQLLPLEDTEIAAALRRSFEKTGIKVLCGAKVGNVVSDETGVSADIIIEGAEPQRLTVDYLLVAVGVTGSIEGLGLETAGVDVSRGFILTDAVCRTSVPNIYAIGDVRGGMLLAHKASAEAAIAVAAIAGKDPEPLDETKIPRCVYAEPSVASVGMTEDEAVRKGYRVKTGRSLFAASGKANAYGQLEGMVKLVFNADDGRLLGAHVLGHDAVELIGELGLARQLEITAGDFVRTVHAHPTLSETVREAAENAIGEKE
jgi:dihydrolipoamide dehydrogenase